MTQAGGALREQPIVAGIGGLDDRDRARLPRIPVDCDGPRGHDARRDEVRLGAQRLVRDGLPFIRDDERQLDDLGEDSCSRRPASMIARGPGPVPRW